MFDANEISAMRPLKYQKRYMKFVNMILEWRRDKKEQNGTLDICLIVLRYIYM